MLLYFIILRPFKEESFKLHLLSVNISLYNEKLLSTSIEVTGVFRLLIARADNMIIYVAFLLPIHFMIAMYAHENIIRESFEILREFILTHLWIDFLYCRGCHQEWSVLILNLFNLISNYFSIVSLNWEKKCVNSSYRITYRGKIFM